VADNQSFAKSFDKRLESLEALGTRLEKTAADLSQPVYPHRDGLGHSQWLGGDEEVIMQRGGTRKAVSRAAMFPADYQPYAVWKGYNRRGDGAFSTFLKEGIRNWRTSEFEQRFQKAGGSFLKTIQGMSEGIGGDGGFAVLPEYSTAIFEKVYENDLFNRTDNYTVVGNSMIFPRLNETSRANGQRAGGLSGNWVGEGGTIPASKIGLGELMLKLKKLAIVVYLTDELIDDAGIALEQYVTRKVTQEFNSWSAMRSWKGPAGRSRKASSTRALCSRSPNRAARRPARWSRRTLTICTAGCGPEASRRARGSSTRTCGPPSST